MSSQVLIDTFVCELDEAPVLRPGFSAAALADPAEACEASSMELVLPHSATNDLAMFDSFSPQANYPFNRTSHRLKIEWKGASVFDGPVRLLGLTSDGYRLELRDGAPEWARSAASGWLRDLPVEFSMTLTPLDICNGWSSDSPVKFLPVMRDAYPQQSAPTDLYPAERLLSVDDYHPFLQLAPLVETIFTSAGYTVESSFLESDLFRSLYMSGAYVSHDTSRLQSRMGFRARRLTTVSAQADMLGRVYADPFRTGYSVGNIVESAQPQSVDEEGELLGGEFFNNGGCFREEEGAVVFRPLSEVTVGFEYRIRYTTDHRILDRNRLAGFDSIYLGPGSDMRFTLANRYVDRRGGLKANYEYRVVVFDHTEGSRYRLTYIRDGMASQFWCEFSGRSAKVTTPATGKYANPVLWREQSGTWLRYASDWALYDGYVEERGRTTVDVRVCSTPVACSPTSPVRFDTLYFHGAEAGMTLTLDRSCALQPLFSGRPGFGEVLGFGDVARHEVRPIELLRAVGHLFNLRFYTEEPARKVWIEPADDFYGAGVDADWRDRTDFSESVEFEELAPGFHKQRTWCYAAGEGAVARADEESGEVFGAWSYVMSSYATMEGDEESRNPLFAPVLSMMGGYANAPSALLLQVGDRDAELPDGNIAPTIVRYCGLHSLPEGERWGYPADRASYPLAAFCYAGDSQTKAFTLTFGNRSGAEGLCNRYFAQTEIEDLRQRITLTLRLEPHEYAALFTPGTGMPDIRSRFQLDTGTGVVVGVLESIERYDPEQSKARCRFIRLMEDRL